MPFVKLDCGILHSSLWAESSDTRICWITLLVLADATGFVRAAISAIAREAGIPAEDARKALDLFQSPDDESRSKENKGKRIEHVEGGYQILNYEKYRERDYTAAERMRRKRERDRVTRNVTVVTRNERNETVTLRKQKQKQSTEADVLSSLVKKKEPKKKYIAPNFSEVLDFFNNERMAQDFYDFYESNGWKVGKNQMKVWKAAAAGWKRRNTKPVQPDPNQQRIDLEFEEAKRKYG